jgi:hypothetical protein
MTEENKKEEMEGNEGEENAEMKPSKSVTFKSEDEGEEEGDEESSEDEQKKVKKEKKPKAEK